MDLKEALDFLPPRVRDAALQAAAQLQALRIRYALAGGVAVGAYGYLRATGDVDFLVGDEAFEHHGALVTFKPGVPIQVGGVLIDYISARTLGANVETLLQNPPQSAGLPVVPIEVLIYMKLVAGRRKDQLDVVELVKAGANPASLRNYLQQHASDLLPLFEQLAREAQE
jgi:hypothetical protein